MQLKHGYLSVHCQQLWHKSHFLRPVFSFHQAGITYKALKNCEKVRKIIFQIIFPNHCNDAFVLVWSVFSTHPLYELGLALSALDPCSSALPAVCFQCFLPCANATSQGCIQWAQVGLELEENQSRISSGMRKGNGVSTASLYWMAPTKVKMRDWWDNLVRGWECICSCDCCRSPKCALQKSGKNTEIRHCKTFLLRGCLSQSRTPSLSETLFCNSVICRKIWNGNQG